MSRPHISFFSEDTDFSLKQRSQIRQWILETVKNEGKTTGQLNFIFCSDEYLLKINQEYLNHDTYTDIVTFDNSEEEDLIEGDIFISIERVRENAGSFKVAEKDELNRVIVHGVLHLLGYKDKKPDDKEIMTNKEDEYLGKRMF